VVMCIIVVGGSSRLPHTWDKTDDQSNMDDRVWTLSINAFYYP
jgi:hypothetical protein